MRRSATWREMGAGAGRTIVSLFGGTLLGFVTGSLVFNVLPGHSFDNPNPVNVAISAVLALGGFIAGSAWWGILMGGIAGSPDKKRMAIAGALGFAPITLAMALLLQVLEPIAVENLAAQYPIHRLFTFLFVPTAFIIASVSAWATGIGLRNPRLASRLFWQVGLAAAFAFLIVNLTMEALGYQVGAPHAAERVTMLTVMFTSDLGAALAGGAVMGKALAGNARGEIATRRVEGAQIGR